MIEKFYPNLRENKIQDIELYNLSRNNIKGLILDIDNTLVPEHVKEADEKAIEWVENVKKAGLKVCLVSNGSQKRVQKFNKELKLYALHRASKPGIVSFLKAANSMGIKPEETAVIGDQIFTDIYGGNRANMFTILVNPLDEKEFIFVRFKRLIEKFVLARHEKSHLGDRKK